MMACHLHSVLQLFASSALFVEKCRVELAQCYMLNYDIPILLDNFCMLLQWMTEPNEDSMESRVVKYQHMHMLLLEVNKGLPNKVRIDKSGDPGETIDFILAVESIPTRNNKLIHSFEIHHARMRTLRDGHSIEPRSQSQPNLVSRSREC